MGISRESQRLTQYVATGIASLGALALGMVIGWSSPVQKSVLDGSAYGFKASDSDFSWISSSALFGAATSSIPSGFLVDKFGRKTIMMWTVLVFLIGWILIICPTSVDMLIVGRFITGLGTGAFAVAIPLYITEIAEVEIRGFLSTFFQIFICLGVELSYIIGAYSPIMWFSVTCGLVPVILAIGLIFLPETPQFLISTGKREAAERSLRWCRGRKYDLTEELASITDIVNKSLENKISFKDIAKNRIAMKGIGILLGVVALQQLSGINAVVFYSNDIFVAAGSSLSPATSSIIIGAVLCAATVPAALVIERAGRKILLIISAVGMACSILILGFYFFYQVEMEDYGWLPLVCLILFFILYSLGAGPIAWIVGAEIFAPEVKGPGFAVGALINWLLGFLVTKFYFDVVKAFGNYTTFWIFSGFCVLGAIHVTLFLPETKGKTIEAVLKEL